MIEFKQIICPVDFSESSVRAFAVAGDPQTTVIDQAISKKADLIVMGTHGRRGFRL